MIAKANEEIRSELLLSEHRRRHRAWVERPFLYLDWTVSQLEAYHLQGKKRVPKRFVRQLDAVREILPVGVSQPIFWRTLIRDAIEQCFDLQEELLRVRDPDYTRMLELELPEESSLGLAVRPHRPAETPAVA